MKTCTGTRRLLERGRDRASHDAGGHTRSSRPRNARYLTAALALILVFMAVEVVIGMIASSLALISDAGHMVTDAAAIALALIAARLAARPAEGNLTYGLKRVEILSAQANGITLWLLAAWFIYEAVQRLLHPPDVDGGLVLGTALVGIVVNVAAAWLVARADRTSAQCRRRVSTHPQRPVRFHNHSRRRPGHAGRGLGPGRRSGRPHRGRVDDQVWLAAYPGLLADLPRGRPAWHECGSHR